MDNNVLFKEKYLFFFVQANIISEKKQRLRLNVSLTHQL